MAKRKPIPKKTRFEVFKRDSFKCQYCGKASPDVVLQIDHIIPVSKGGTNDILNLVTSCEECNGGKSDCRLSDVSAVQKSREQAENLQERQNQIEMLLEWRKGLQEQKDQIINQLAAYWEKLAPGFGINAQGRSKFRDLIRRFTPQEIIEAMEIASERYLIFVSNKEVTAKSWDKAWDKIGGIAYNKKFCDPFEKRGTNG